MLEIFKLFNDSKPLIADMTNFMKAWTDFMNKLHERLTRFEARLDSVDSRVQTVIEIVSDGHPATVTPDLHAVVEKWAADDPRKVEPVKYAPDRVAFVSSLMTQAGKSEHEANEIYDAQFLSPAAAAERRARWDMMGLQSLPPPALYQGN